MSNEMSEEEFAKLLDEASKRIADQDAMEERVKLENAQAFLDEGEIPELREAVEYMKMYDELKRLRGRDGIKCRMTNRKALACRVAIMRESDRRGVSA